MTELFRRGERRSRWPASLLLALGCLGCEVRLDDSEEALAGDPRFYSAEERCVVPGPASLTFSLTFPEGSYLISADAGVGVALRPDDDPCTALEGLATGELAAVPLLELNEAELEAGTETDDGYELALVPRSGFVAFDQGYLFYEKLLTRGVFDVVHIGVGVASVRFGEPAVRLEPRVIPSEPTLLWLESRAGKAISATLGRDGFVHVYDTFVQSEWDLETFVSRVPESSLLDPGAYEYSGDDRKWVDTREQARVFLRDVPAVSAAYNAHLGAYVFLYAGALSDTVFGRIGPANGPLGEVQRLYTGVSPEEFWIRDVTIHGAFGSADGRTFLTSYFSDTGDALAGIRFVDVTLR